MGRVRLHPTTFKFCKKCGIETERAGGAKDRKHGRCLPCTKKRRESMIDACRADARARYAARKPPTLMEQGLLPKKPITRLPDGLVAVYLAEFRSKDSSEIFYKVGLSKDPSKRVQEAGGGAYQTRCLSIRVFPDKHEALLFERAYHEAHSQKYTPEKAFFGSKGECYLQPTSIYHFNN
jgi:hypothetical protein